ncbi:MAG: PTS galactosamine/N-acetylgalactosamine transporter subunit IIA [Erysipelotrichaceae bacterium]|nr:PTS galactosamine/N-acetylgalactosamine transporter subunit IIA [Erysipelotrichaceae bacterium]
MIGLIVTGHGNFATGITSSLKLIGGEPTDYRAVDFTIEMSTDDLEAKLLTAMDELSHCSAVLVLSDLIGGSPFKTAAIISASRENVQVIGGTNLGMLLETSMSRFAIEDLDQLANIALEAGKTSVAKFSLAPVEEPSSDEEDGI